MAGGDLPPVTSRFSVRRRLATLDVYYGWVIVAACFLASFTAYGLIYSFSVLLPSLIDAFGRSHAETILVFSVQSGFVYSGAVIGFFLDRYSTRRLYFLGTALVGLGVAGTGLLASYDWALLLYGAVSGTGLAIVIVVTYVTPIVWFDRREGIAIGIATSGTGIGMLVMPPLTAWILGAVGWQQSLVVIGVFAFVSLSVLTVVLDDGPARAYVDASAEFTTAPVADTAGSLAEDLREIRGIVLSVPFVLLLFTYFGIYAPSFALTINIVEFTRTQGIGVTVGIVALSVLGLTNAGGKLLVGYAIDRTRTATVIAVCSLVMSLAMVVVVLRPRPPAIWPPIVVFGLAYGGLGALITPMIGELTDSRNLNSLYGIVSIAVAVAGAAGPYLAGLSYDTYGTFVPAFLGLTGFGFAAAVTVLLADRFGENFPVVEQRR